MDTQTFPFHWSPSAFARDARCRMLTYWGKVLGIRPVGQGLHRGLGTIIHRAVFDTTATPEARMAQAERDTRDLLDQLMIQDPLRTEYPIYVQAAVYGFITRVLNPRLRAGTQILATEPRLEPRQVHHGKQLRWLTFPDWILQDPDGTKLYVDLKTTSLDQAKFTQSWEMSVQLNVGVWAAKCRDFDVDGMQIFGIHKGHMYKGSLRGPLVAMYRSPSPDPAKAKYSVPSKSKWSRCLITEYPGGIMGWVDDLPVDVVAKCFPVTAVLTPDDRLLGHIHRQAMIRAEEIQEFLDTPQDELDYPGLMSRYFPRSFPEACRDARSGRQCDMFEACWNPVVAKDPVGSRLYEYIPEEEEELDGDSEGHAGDVADV